jgi:hypothetical protein
LEITPQNVALADHHFLFDVLELVIQALGMFFGFLSR